MPHMIYHKDYSDGYNQALDDILPEVEKLENEIKELKQKLIDENNSKDY
jgi:hypothetical protein